MNEVEALPQMMLQQVANDVMLRINDVALRANGIYRSLHTSVLGFQLILNPKYV